MVTTLITIGGISIVLGISMITDANGTIKYVMTIISVGGIGYILKKVVATMDKDKADMIGFASWCGVGIAMVGILRNCKIGIVPIINEFRELGETLASIKGSVDGIGLWLDKVMMWTDKLPWN
jgi:hypothetical protein